MNIDTLLHRIVAQFHTYNNGQLMITLQELTKAITEYESRDHSINDNDNQNAYLLYIYRSKINEHFGREYNDETQYSMAVKDAESAIQLNTDSVECYAQLALVYTHWGRISNDKSKFKDAEYYFLKAINTGKADYNDIFKDEMILNRYHYLKLTNLTHDVSLKAAVNCPTIEKAMEMIKDYGEPKAVIDYLQLRGYGDAHGRGHGHGHDDGDTINENVFMKRQDYDYDIIKEEVNYVNDETFKENTDEYDHNFTITKENFDNHDRRVSIKGNSDDYRLSIAQSNAGNYDNRMSIVESRDTKPKNIWADDGKDAFNWREIPKLRSFDPEPPTNIFQLNGIFLYGVAGTEVITEDDLLKVYSKFGKVLFIDKCYKRINRYAFCHFDNPISPVRAVAAMDRKHIEPITCKGDVLRVRFSPSLQQRDQFLAMDKSEYEEIVKAHGECPSWRSDGRCPNRKNCEYLHRKNCEDIERRPDIMKISSKNAYDKSQPYVNHLVSVKKRLNQSSWSLIPSSQSSQINKSQLKLIAVNPGSFQTESVKSFRSASSASKGAYSINDNISQLSLKNDDDDGFVTVKSKKRSRNNTERSDVSTLEYFTNNDTDNEKFNSSTEDFNPLNEFRSRSVSQLSNVSYKSSVYDDLISLSSSPSSYAAAAKVESFSLNKQTPNNIFKLQGLFIGNLKPDIEESDVRKAFIRFGSITKIMKPNGGKYAFIHFKSHDAATKAVEMYQGHYDESFCDGPLKLRFSPSEEQFRVYNMTSIEKYNKIIKEKGECPFWRTGRECSYEICPQKHCPANKEIDSLPEPKKITRYDRTYPK